MASVQSNANHAPFTGSSRSVRLLCFLRGGGEAQSEPSDPASPVWAANVSSSCNMHDELSSAMSESVCRSYMRARVEDLYAKAIQDGN